MSRLFVEARAPISLNFFSSVCKRRSISPVWAEANWPNLDELDITVSFFLMSFVLKKRQLDPICSRILRGMMMTGGRPTRLQPATPGGQEHGTGRLWEPAFRNSAPVNYPRMAETVFRPTTLKFITGAPRTAVDRRGPRERRRAETQQPKSIAPEIGNIV
jgi:hypothetical protein